MYPSLLVAIALTGCGFGIGSMSATTRPVAGRQVVLDEDWSSGCSQHVIDTKFRWYGKVDIIQEFCGSPVLYTGMTKATRYFGMGGGWKRGTATSTLQGEALPSSSINEIDATVMGHLPIKRFGLSLGATFVAGFEGDASFTGGGFRGSFALIPQLSIDAAYLRISGHHSDEFANRVDFSGPRSSIGGTLMLYGLKQTRLALSVAYTTTDAGDYQSHGYTYQLVYTLW